MSTRPVMTALFAKPSAPEPMSKWTWHADKVAVPVLGAGCVLIRVHAAGLRRSDLSDAHFYKRLSDRGALIPSIYVPGTDVSGVIMSVAPDVQNYSSGDEVIAYVSGEYGGGCAEMVEVPVVALWPKPVRMCHAEACAMGTDGCAALQALEAAARYLPMVSPRVLVTGAAAGAGIFIAQAVKALHKAHLTVVYRDMGALEVLERLECDKVVYLGQNSSIVNKIPASSFDVVFDTAGIAFKVCTATLFYLCL